jgi:hypothetical protein
MIRFAAFAALIAVSSLAVVGCKEDQVLYKTDKASTTGPAGSTPAPVMAEPTTSTAPPSVEHPAPAAESTAIAEFPPPAADRALLPAADLAQAVTVAKVTFGVPDSWKATTPSSAMRKAQFAIPASTDGARGGEMAVFHFGAGQGGDAQSNINRWLGQVDRDPGTPLLRARHTVNGLTITEIGALGTLRASTMGTGPTTPQAGSMFYGVVVEGGPEGALFIRITGDAASIDAALPAIAGMVATMKAGD